MEMERWARDIAVSRRKRRRFIGVVGIVLCAGVMLFSLVRGDYIVSGLCLVALVAIERLLIPTMAHLFGRQKQAERGADAETLVAKELAVVSDNLAILHNVAGPYGDLDHIVFRANGAVAVLDTKSHRGRVTEASGRLRINGRPFEKDVVNQVYRNVLWFKDLLKSRYGIEAFVTAILVFPNARVDVRRPVKGVEVSRLGFLPTLLCRLPANARTASKVRQKLETMKSEIAGASGERS